MTRHIPVLMDEVIERLHLENGDVVVDATLGGGGHTLAILERVLPDGRVIAFDTDVEAITRFEERLKEFPEAAAAKEEGKLILVHRNFSGLGEVLRESGITEVNAILADLGFSSDQIEAGERGLSFQLDGPLDMRLDRRTERTAADIVNMFTEGDLFHLLERYGEERYARRIAKAIVARRLVRPFERTKELADVIESAYPAAERRRKKIHPATKTFQALRIVVNDEWEILRSFLSQAVSVLAIGGRIAVISFHSGEDALVKAFFRKEASGCVCPPEFPVCRCGVVARVKILTTRPIIAGEMERAENSRSRSARLRVAERIP